MRDLLDGMNTAFSMYTILPVPPAKWDRGGMRYALCFLPLVGLIVTLFLVGWQYLGQIWHISAFLFAVVATLIPIVLSGGIHMDGLLDSVDALASHAPTQRKLEILSDPHVGAFGVIGCVCYLLLSCALWYELAGSEWWWALLPAGGQVLSRALTALSIVNLPCARTTGLCALFAGNADRRAVRICCGLAIIGCALFFVLVDRIWGTVALVASVICWRQHRRTCQTHFGGNTGDLAGYLNQKIELITLLSAAVGGLVS